MKKITLLFLIVVSCGVQEANAQTCVSDNLNHPLDRYINQKNFVPKVADSVKSMRVNINVIQNKVGDERNFINISKHTDFLKRIIDSLNSGFSKLKVPSNPKTCVCGTDCYLEDTRIKFELQNIKFILDSVWYQDSIPSRQLSLHPNNNLSVFNVYITSGTFGGGSNGTSYSILNNPLGFVGRGYYQKYLADTAIDTNTNADNLHWAAQLIAGHMQHEIGHSFGLLHLYEAGPGQLFICCPETTDTNNVDYIWDFFGKGTPSCPKRKLQYGDWCNTTPNDTCFANWMGRNIQEPLHRELTPLQIGRMHRATMLSRLRKYFKPSANHVTDHEILTNETWDFNIRMYGDIVVKSGATLTIRCHVLMPPEGEIRVEPNGKLIVDGGTITSTEDGPNNWWNGIRVEGTDGLSQYDTNSTFGYGHGHVIIKDNAVIENAITGISTHNQSGFLGGGGVIHASHSTFRNNVYSVRMGKFQDIGAHKDKKNRSFFENCTFDWDSTYLDKNKYIRTAMELIEVKKVTIDSCTFINKDPAFFPFDINDGVGITTIDASTNIKNCAFNDLYKGVHVGMAVCSAPAIIQYNNFTSCYFGALVYKAEYSVIQQNIFKYNKTGIRLAETKGFEVSENQFLNGTFGINNWNLQKHSNEIYNNTFAHQNTGISVRGYGNKSNSGLSFKCNYFATNLIRYRDISVFKGEVDNVQGKCKPTFLDPEKYPAGNEFSHECTNTYGDFYAYYHPVKIDYNHHYQIGSGPYRPLCYSDSIYPKRCQTGYDNNLSCPDSTFSQSYSPVQWLSKSSGTKDMYNYNKTEHGSSELTVSALIDGGNTSGCLSYIDPINAYDSYLIKTEMINHSPYLSEDVLIACMNRAPALNDTDLFDILAANSPLSLELAEALDYLTAVLSSSQIVALQDLQGGISKRDSIENDVRWYEQQSELALNELLRLFVLDTNGDNPTDSMIHYLEDWDSPASKELLVPLYWEKEEFTKAQNAIDAIANEEENEHLDYVLQKMHDMLSNGDSIAALLPDTLTLDSIALDSTKAGQAWAQNIMYRLTGKLYPVSLPDTAGSPPPVAPPVASPLLVKEELKNQNIQIFPNPNNGEFVITFNNIRAKNIIVYSINGREVYKSALTSNEKQEVILPARLSGIFQLVIYGQNEEVIHTEKIVVNE